MKFLSLKVNKSKISKSKNFQLLEAYYLLQTSGYARRNIYGIIYNYYYSFIVSFIRKKNQVLLSHIYNYFEKRCKQTIQIIKRLINDSKQIMLTIIHVFMSIFSLSTDILLHYILSITMQRAIYKYPPGCNHNDLQLRTVCTGSQD